MQQSPNAAREQARWMRENASLWVRPDAARFLISGTRPEDVYPAFARKYNPNQPRVPSGNPDGGQWTDVEGGGGITDPRVMSDADPERVQPGAQYAQVGSSVADADGLSYYARGGHHELRRGVYEKWDLQPETRKVFENSTTGSLPGGTTVRTDRFAVITGMKLTVLTMMLRAN